jgi:hypothetical protein
MSLKTTLTAAAGIMERTIEIKEFRFGEGSWPDFKKEGKELFDLLYKYLPSGTYDALQKNMRRVEKE